jgi:nitroreductase
MVNISETIKKRISFRAYEDKPVAADDLEKIVEAGRWAPNAGPFQISVIRNKQLLQKINDRAYDGMLNSGIEFLVQRASLPGYQPLYSAPVLMLLSGPSNAPFGAINAALAAENIILEATGLGLGTCLLLSPAPVLNDAKKRDLAEAAGVPEGYTVHCAVIVGHAASENKFSYAERVPKGSVNYVD